MNTPVHDSDAALSSPLATGALDGKEGSTSDSSPSIAVDTVQVWPNLEIASDGLFARYTAVVTPDLLINWGEYRARRGVVVDTDTLTLGPPADEPLIELHCQLEGEMCAVIDGVGPVHLRSGDSNLVHVPFDVSPVRITEDCRGRVFEVKMTPAFLEDLATRYAFMFGDVRSGLQREMPLVWSAHPIPMSPAARATIQRVIEQESASRLFLESQVLELLARTYQTQRQTPLPHRNAAPDRGDLSARDFDRMYAARDILLDRFTDPPTLPELARRVGTNEFALKQGFRAVFGTSAYALLLAHKLETARRLVVDTQLTIAEVAYRVGYSDPAHLTTAFKKKFGLRPSDLRA
jgi:AraC-like DNA-binding protein